MRTAAFQTPGLYLGGIESHPPLHGLTAVTGFVGVSEKGPPNSPQPIRNWGEFIEVFGDMISYGHLPYSVYGFFLNGGRKCYVVRIANPDRQPKNIGDCPTLDPLLKAKNGEPIHDRSGEETIKISAIDEGRWGNEIRVAISYKTQKAKLAKQTVPADPVIKVDTTYDFAIGEKIAIASRKVTQSYVISDVDLVTNTIILTRQVGKTYPEGSIISGQDLIKKAELTQQTSPLDNAINVDTTNVFAIGEEITITNPRVTQFYVIASVDPGSNTITLSAPVNETFPTESIISGQQLSQRPIKLAKLDQETTKADTVIRVDSAADFVAGDQFWIVHKDNPFVKRLYDVQDADIVNQTVTLKSNVDEIFPKESTVRGRGFRVTVTFRDRREDFEDLSMNQDSPHYFVFAINGDPTYSQSYIEKQKEGHSILINVEQVLDGELSRFRPSPGVYRLIGGGDGFTYATETLKDGADADSIAVIAKLRGKEGNKIHVRCEPFQTKTALSIPGGPSGPSNQITVLSAAGFSVNDTLKIESDGTIESKQIIGVDPEHNIINLDSDLANTYPIGAAVSVDSRFTLTVFRDDAENPVEESHCNLSLDAGDPDHFFKTRINSNSQFICVEQSGATIQIPEAQEVILKGGKDPGNIDLRYYTGYGNDEFFTPPANTGGGLLGVATFEHVTEINLLSVPDLWQLYGSDPQGFSQTDYIKGLNHSLYHCRKMGDRFALLDLPPDIDTVDAAFWPSKISTSDLARFGALYYPWLVFTYQQKNYTVPPSGFVAGLTAQSDSSDGVNKAPANLIVRGIVGLERSIDADDQEALNIRGVNCFREFDNIGIKLWGSRTLSLEAPHLYINARRVLLGIIKALASNLLWAVFEPNDRALWKKIESSLNAFLVSMLVKGMMASDRPGDAFYIKCDDETNTRESIEAGQVITEIGVALVAPAEFIVITVKKTADSINITEESA